MPTSRTLLAPLAATAALLVAPGAAPAAVKDCNGTRADSVRQFNLVTVTSVRNMSCAAALRVATRSALSGGASAARKGGRFRLGSWSCVTTLADYESFASRCTLGGKAFRFAWGS